MLGQVKAVQPLVVGKNVFAAHFAAAIVPRVIGEGRIELLVVPYYEPESPLGGTLAAGGEVSSADIIEAREKWRKSIRLPGGTQTVRGEDVRTTLLEEAGEELFGNRNYLFGKVDPAKVLQVHRCEVKNDAGGAVRHAKYFFRLPEPFPEDTLRTMEQVERTTDTDGKTVKVELLDPPKYMAAEEFLSLPRETRAPAHHRLAVIKLIEGYHDSRVERQYRLFLGSAPIQEFVDRYRR